MTLTEILAIINYFYAKIIEIYLSGLYITFFVSLYIALALLDREEIDYFKVIKYTLYTSFIYPFFIVKSFELIALTVVNAVIRD